MYSRCRKDGKWQAAAAVFCVKSKCGKKIQIQRETEFQEFRETLFSCIFNKSTLYTIYVSTVCVCAGSAWSSCRCCPASPSSSSTSCCSPPCAGPSSAGAASPSTGAVVLSAHAQYVISNTSGPTTTPRRGATRSAAPSWAGRYYILTVASLSNTSCRVKGDSMTQKKSEFLLLLLMLDDFIHLSTFREEPNISNFTPSFVF